MVPDLPSVREDGSGGGGGIDHTRRVLHDGILNGNTNCNGAPPKTEANVQSDFSTTKLTSYAPSVENGALYRTKHTFWPPLKAVPLASYYKLHRVPSLDSLTATVMAEQQNDVQAIELPHSDASHVEEPQDKSPPRNAVHNRILENVIRTPGRQPSPQPTHLSVPGPSQHRVLPEQGSGYVAPTFDGKDQQMDQGKLP